jgi:uncharacterized membrane protein
MDSRLPKILFLLIVAGAAIHFSSYYAQLPDVVQSHFSSRGNANGWQTKTVFFSFMVGITVLATFFTLGLPAMLRAMPAEIFNLPNKEYWLAPDRREASFDFISGWFAWFGCALFLVACYAFEYAIQANLHPGHVEHPERLLYAIFGFLCFTLAWIARMFVRFLTPPQSQ